MLGYSRDVVAAFTVGVGGRLVIASAGVNISIFGGGTGNLKSAAFAWWCDLPAPGVAYVSARILSPMYSRGGAAPRLNSYSCGRRALIGASSTKLRP